LESDVREEAAKVRIWIGGGGTGGHIYPGLAVIQALVADSFERHPSGRVPEILYVGRKGGVEEQIVTRAGVRFEGVQAGGIHGLSPWQAIRNLVKLTRGWGAAYQLGRRERPSALFVTGGYASLPAALAAWTLRVPILVYLPDIEPGLAVRFIARLATSVAVTVADSGAYFLARKVVVTGYPVRAEFYGLDRERACALLGLAADDVVLAVLGGSRGAGSINRALSSELEAVLELAQVVHVSGKADWSWVAERRDGLPAALKPRYHAYPYLHDEMGPALAAADLALCRAGASTLGELPFFGLPAVLVPYPHAWRYQRSNADWLVDRGAAVRLDDARLGDDLLQTLRRLINDQGALASMAANMRGVARPDAAARLAAELRALAG
jgi:UDP-N-acetylglucosamine--N-acetylmuramyl-(pentapeptide) pyrophosphoryl-undecaprenol N-acetylglucosamine transferase